MVEAEDVEEIEVVFEAVDPPGEALGAFFLPEVEWVAPELAEFGEVVGGDASDVGWVAGFVEFKDTGIGPYVGAIE